MEASRSASGNQCLRSAAMAAPSPAHGSRRRWVSSWEAKLTSEASLGSSVDGVGKYPPRATDWGRAMVGRLLFRGKMRSRLRLEELCEGRVIDVAVEGGLVADGFKTGVEKPSGAPLRAGALLAPGLVERGSIELQVEGEIVGDVSSLA